MTPARHNLVHAAKQLGLDIHVDCFANGTIATWETTAGPMVAMLDNHASYEEARDALVGARKASKMQVKPEHRPSSEAMTRLGDLLGVNGANGVSDVANGGGPYPLTARKQAHPKAVQINQAHDIWIVLGDDGHVTWSKGRP